MPSTFFTGLFGNFFHERGGGVVPIPKTFVNLPSNFWYAKLILRCLNIFYTQGELISDQFYHLKLIWFWVPIVQSGKKMGSFGNFSLEGERGGPLFPKVNVKIWHLGKFPNNPVKKVDGIPYHLCICQLFTCSSDFYILRKSCNCYFTAEKKNVSLLCALLSETTPGEWFVHQNVVNYYWTFEANWLLQADLSSKVVLLASYSKQYSSTLSSQFVQSGLFTAPPLKIKILGHFLLLFAWIAPTSWQLVSTILDEPNIKSCNKVKISNFLLFITLLYINSDLSHLIWEREVKTPQECATPLR